MKHRREYDLKVIGANLKYYRKKNNFSVDYVREYLRLGSNQAIYKWESGSGYPQADTLLSLMELYGIEVKELLDETKEIHSNITYAEVVKSFIIKEIKIIDEKGRQKQFRNRIEKYFRKNIEMQMNAAVV